MRFTIRWCPGHLRRAEVEGAGYQFGDLNAMLELYSPDRLRDGYNCVRGEEVFYISNPGLGLWAYEGKLGG